MKRFHISLLMVGLFVVGGLQAALEGDDLQQIRNQVNEAVDARLMDGGANRLGQLGRAVGGVRGSVNDISKLKECLMDSVVHGAGATIVGEYVKAFASKHPEQLAKSPFTEEQTNQVLELLGTLGWDFSVKAFVERNRSIREGNDANYKAQGWDALKNAEASAVITFFTHLLSAVGQKAGLTEKESKPWEKLSESQKWVVECAVHALVKNKVTEYQG